MSTTHEDAGTPGPTGNPSLRDYADLLYRQRFVALLGVIAVVGLAAVATSFVTPMYRSTAAVLLRTIDTSSTFPASPDVDNNWLRQTATELDFARSDAFLARVADVSPNASVVTSQQESNSTLFYAEPTTLLFEGTSSEPTAAAAAAGAYSKVYVEIRHEADQQAVESEIGRLTSSLSDVRGALVEARLPLVEIDTRIAAATNTDVLARLLRTRTEVLEQISSSVDRLESDEARLDRRLDANLDASEILQNGEASARLVSSAGVPSAPFSPNWLRNLLVALVLGIMLGVGAALFRDSLDDKIREEEDLEAIGLQPLGRIPVLEGTNDDGSPLVHTLARTESVAADAFRNIVTSIQFLRGEKDLKIIQIVSADPGEGKTTISVNLAAAMAQFGDSVCLIDGDMRRPRVHEFFPVERANGLSSVLAGLNSTNEVVFRPDGVDLMVIPAGAIPPNPSELLANDRFVALVKSLADVFQTVIVDSPPVLPVPDARVIAQVVDGVILVARSGSTRKEALELAANKLRPSRVPMLGAVLNGHTADGRYYRYDEYGYQTEES